MSLKLTILQITHLKGKDRILRKAGFDKPG